MFTIETYSGHGQIFTLTISLFWLLRAVGMNNASRPLNLFDGKYKHFVVEDKKAHLDLNQIANAVKLNDDIYDSSAD